MSDAVRSGQRPEANRTQEDHPDWVPTFTRALFESSREPSRATARLLASLIPETGTSISVLDLGGGHGAYSIELARIRPDVVATVFDKPEVVVTTQEIVEESGLTKQVDVVAGDFHEHPVGTDYDVVLLFGVLHGETSDGATRLLTTVRRSLAPDGRLIIRTRERRSESDSPGERELFDLHMLLSTAGGQVRKSANTISLLEKHGFRLSQQVDSDSPDAGSLLIFVVDHEASPSG